ncbi:alkaline phosphatase family protein [Labedaea rhizosphaerae]|uniref:Putative AlkP superfamily pyrophosphatase or phosphodiesterase n=1 Tax=Labedaea rhizosphaerae TaxID=598644 RepID=A0A4R6SKS5_LABRH|nr:alkaline phosphatase family protein [Labedaea rhizosphaerae]TDQ01559.1 putative AlkP superfamily pyrophosphatase or phosphodiesterase [Labedaea rhizosphaerae]
MNPPVPMLPRYGAGSLAEVASSLVAGMGGPGTPTLDMPARPKVCLLLVDGLGWHLLRAHPGDAPFLNSLAEGRGPITSGFPATTAASIAAIGTGRPPGENGVVGLSFAVDGEVLNALRWNRHGVDGHVDLRDTVVPERMQPEATVFERAAATGIAVRIVAPREQRRSGLTRAVLRGGEFQGVHALGDLTAVTIEAMTAGDRVFCYAYHGDLDLMGHAYGPGTEPWRRQLRHVDLLAESIAGALPSDGMLVVVADHGMITVAADDRIDLDDLPALRAGVAMIGGEPRVRHLYTEPGAVADVRAAWQETLGDRAWIRTRDEAAAEGWFGPSVTDRVRGRIGDLVVAATGTTGLVRTAAEPVLSAMIGQHGSLTPEELLVPLLIMPAEVAGAAR